MTWQERIVHERRKRSVEHIKKYREVEEFNHQLKEEECNGKVDGDGQRDSQRSDDP